MDAKLAALRYGGGSGGGGSGGGGGGSGGPSPGVCSAGGGGGGDGGMLVPADDVAMGPAPPTATRAAVPPAARGPLMMGGFSVLFPPDKKPFPAQLAVMSKARARAAASNFLFDAGRAYSPPSRRLRSRLWPR